ncbi:hypothetical protein RJ640_018181 [Escallonia rubra]|uniref:Uncharacterized protein n=1 Tax=Escallonia rubra TaxID=112253 RepID=A0AA88QV14_9ASTE|nr:hypothetical protein RJ640_018181 [Escallonia rubra]
MNPILTSFRAATRLDSTKFRFFCATSLGPQSQEPIALLAQSCKKSGGVRESGRARAKASDAQLKETWLDSLTYPLPVKPVTFSGGTEEPPPSNSGSKWVIGVDPDACGALALLKTDEDSCCSAQIFDSPHVKVPIGGRIRRRLDAKSIIQLLQTFDAPIGTISVKVVLPVDKEALVATKVRDHGLKFKTCSMLSESCIMTEGEAGGTPAYVEQSRPFPKDGKQGWWSGGFNYGLWVGVLVASGFSVVPLSSLLWKNEYKLAGNGSSKDDSREVASSLFPSMASFLKRKKDHGRAEALLIAAYGKGLKINLDSSCSEASI